MLALVRLKDWDKRLAWHTERHMTLPGVWGESDCLLTCFDAVWAVTDHDPGAGIRGKYSTEAGAAKLLRERGFENVEQALASLFPDVGRLLAQRGDLGTVERDGKIFCGYVTEYGFGVKTETGLIFVPQTSLRKAFKVG